MKTLTKRRALITLGVVLQQWIHLPQPSLALTCSNSAKSMPKLILSETDESKITAMEVKWDDLPFRALVGGYTNNGVQTAFIGNYRSQDYWQWRFTFSDFTGITDPQVQSLKLNQDSSKVAVLFASTSAPDTAPTYLAEYSVNSGQQTSPTKLQLPTLTWAGPQSMVYLGSKLIVALAPKRVELSTNVIAIIDFSKQGQDQVKMKALNQVQQITSHLVYISNTEFFLGSTVAYYNTGSNKVGISFVRYNFVNGEITESSSTQKKIIFDDAFPAVSDSPALYPRLTAYRSPFPSQGLSCGGIKASTSVWVFISSDGAGTTTITSLEQATDSVISDCNISSTGISLYFLLAQVTGGNTIVKLVEYNRDTGQPDTKNLIVSNQSPLLTFGVLRPGTYTNVMFAMQLSYVDDSGASFAQATAALFYSEATPPSCVTIKQTSNSNESFAQGSLQAKYEYADVYTDNLATSDFSQSIIDKSVKQDAMSYYPLVSEDYCTRPTLAGGWYSSDILAASVLGTDHSEQVVSLNKPTGAPYTCNVSEFQYFFASSSPALPAALTYYFAFASNSWSLKFRLQPDFVPVAGVYQIAIATAEPDMEGSDESYYFIQYLDLEIIVNCAATISSTTQDVIDYAYEMGSGETTFNFKPFTLANDSDSCTKEYVLTILQAGVAMGSSFNEATVKTIQNNGSNLTYNFQKASDCGSAADYKFKLTLKINGVEQSSFAELPFAVTLDCAKLPISWNGDSSLFIDHTYTLFKSDTDPAWTWTDVNTDAGKSQLTPAPCQAKCGNVVMKFLNAADKTPLDSTLFTTSQTSFHISNQQSGTWSAANSISLFFMYQNAIDAEGRDYYNNKRDFMITIDDACASQAENDISSHTQSDQTFYLGSSPQDIYSFANVAFTNKPWCPWKAEVDLNNSMVHIVNDIAAWQPQNVILRVTDDSPQADYTISITFKFAYSYAGTFGVSKTTSFQLHVKNCATQITAKSIATQTYIMTTSQAQVDITPDGIDAQCGNDLSITIASINPPLSLPSAISLDGTNLVIFVAQNDADLVGNYQVSLRFEWQAGAYSTSGTVNVLIVDVCEIKLVPPSDATLTYTLMMASQTASLKPEFNGESCRYNVLYVSGLDDANLQAIVTLTVGTVGSRVDENFDAKISVVQTDYRPQVVGSHAVVFRYTWSVDRQQDVTITLDLNDDCVTKLQPPSSPITQSYVLMEDGPKPLPLDPVIESGYEYCKFGVEYVTGTIGNLLSFTNFAGVISEFQAAPALLNSASYSRSYLGPKTLQFDYTWSKATRASVTVDLTITDQCSNGFAPPASPAQTLEYVLQAQQAEVQLTPTFTKTYCNYNVVLQSVDSAGTETKDNDIWQWTADVNDAEQATIVKFGAHTTQYDSSLVGSYTATFIYTWSASESANVEVPVVVTDDCSQQIMIPTIPRQTYTVFNAQLNVNVSPSAPLAFSFCDYSASVAITKTGTPVNSAVFSLHPGTKQGVTSPSTFGVFLNDLPSNLLDSAYTTSFDIEVTYSYSKSSTSSITFTLDILNPCFNAVPGPSLQSDSFYKINDSTPIFYTFSPFTMTPSSCSVSYTYEVAAAITATTNKFVSLDAAARRFKFLSTTVTTAELGSYQITIKAVNDENNANFSQTTFNVSIVANYCETTQFTFQSGVFIDKTYQFPLDPIYYQWSSPLVTTDTTQAQCGTLWWDFFILQDGSLTLLANSRKNKLFTLSGSRLKVFSNNNREDIGTFTLAIKAWFSNYSAYPGVHTFNVKVDDALCRNTKLSASEILNAQGTPISGRFEHLISFAQSQLTVQFATAEKDCPLTDLRLTSDRGDISKLMRIKGWNGKTRSLASAFDNAPPKDVTLIIGENDLKKYLGTYTITLTAVSGHQVSVSFNLIITQVCVARNVQSPPSPPDQSYTSKADARVVTWDPFTHDLTEPTCNPAFTYSLNTRRLQGNGPEFPKDLIDFKPFLNEMVIFGSFELSGKFVVTVQATLNDDDKTSTSFDFLLELFGLPLDYSAVIMQPVVLNVLPGSKALDSPNFTADDILSYGVTTSNPLVSFDPISKTWQISEDWNFLQPQTLEAEVTYTSSLYPGVKKTQKFAVIINPVTPLGSESIGIKLPDRTSMINYFAHSEKSHKDPPLFTLKKVDSFGIATLTCNKKINQTWEWNQTLLEYGMRLSVRPGIGQLSLLDFNWSYIKFSYDTQQLLLKLNFTEPLDVSAGLTYDYLVVHTNASIINGLFYDVYGVKFGEDQVIEAYLPHLLADGSASALLAASILPVQAVLSSVMASSFVLNLFLAGSVSFLWGMMYALQLIVHLPLVNVYFPANAKLFFEVITKIATFKLLDVDQILGLLDHNRLKDAEPLFAESGYKSKSKVLNLGFYLVALAVMLLTILALGLAHRWLRQRSFGVKLIQLVKKYFLWRIPIRYLLSTYLGFAIPTMMSYKIQTWGPWHATLNSLTNILMLVALGFFPLYATIILLRNFGRLQKPDFMSKFNSLYLNINATIESNVLFTFVFCCRRMLFAFLIVYLKQWPTFQIMVLLHLTTLTMSYIAYNKPFNLSLLNSLELINEVTILIAVYHLTLFTDYVGKHETKYLVGWSLCTITAINIMTNLVFLIVTQTRAIYLEYKRNPAFVAKCKSSLKKVFTCTKEKKPKEAKREKNKVEMFDVDSPDQLQEDSSDASLLVRPSVRSFDIASKILSLAHEQEMIDRFNETDKAQSTHGGKQDSDIEVLDLEMQSNLDSPKSSKSIKSYHASKFQQKHFARNRQLVRDLQIVAQNNLKD